MNRMPGYNCLLGMSDFIFQGPIAEYKSLL
jgi:hypothetical protein